MTKQYYTTPEGAKYPLSEAPYKYAITCFKTDCRKAVVGDPTHCLIALGALHDKDVLAAYIGAGKDAYIVFKGKRKQNPYALHFTINAEAARLRDRFDTEQDIQSVTIRLTPPTAGRTLSHRAKLGQKRREAVKSGASVKSRGKPNKSRIMRIGVPLRPRAKIEKNTVTVPQPEAAE